MGESATEINILLKDSADIDKEIKEIKEILSIDSTNYTIMGWEELAKDYIAIAETKRGASSMILFLVFIIAAVGISNTMLMAMYERTRELGMMRAMGMKDSSIRLLIIVEAGGIGLIGALIGTFLGIITNVFLIKYGIDMGMMLRDMDVGYRITSIIRGAWNIQTLIISIVSGMVLSMVVAYFPVRRALKEDIPSALHHQ